MHVTAREEKRQRIKRAMSDYKHGSTDSRRGTGFKPATSQKIQFTKDRIIISKA